MTYIIGIDGGGTKTEIVLASFKGNVIAKAIGGPTNPNLLSKEELHQNLKELLAEIEDQASMQYLKVRNLFAGISGAGIKESQIDFFNILTDLIPNDITVQVAPDTINALYSGTYGAPGIVQIAGTGSITFGINEKNEQDRIGGWGYLFGDEGSGFDIGRRGILEVLKSKDGLAKETKLTHMMFSHFNVVNERELIHKVYSSPVPKDEISPLSRIVFEAYKEQDDAAIKIIHEVSREISENIITLYKNHFNPQESTKVVLCGGVFKEKEILPRLIQHNLKDFPNIITLQPEIQPVGGSIIGAYLIDDIMPTPTVIENIKTTLREDERE